MKIIIKPTAPPHYGIAHNKVSVEHPSDDLTLDEVMELVAGALKAYGFNAQMVDEAIPPR